MAEDIFEVKRERFDLLRPEIYLLQGTWPEGYRVEAYLKKQQISGEVMPWDYVSVLERAVAHEHEGTKRVTVSLTMPKKIEPSGKLVIYATRGGKKIKWFEIGAKELARRQNSPYFYIDEQKTLRDEEICRVRGWVVSDQPVKIAVYDEKKKRIFCEIQRNKRMDVAEMITETEVDPKCGFYMEVPIKGKNVINLVFRAGQNQAVYSIGQRPEMIAAEKVKKYVKTGRRYLQNHGSEELMEKVLHKIKSLRHAPIDYAKWLPKHLQDKVELEHQRKTKFAREPKFSIIVPLYKTPVKYLEQMVQSVKQQTYPNWELVLSDGSGKDSPLKGVLARMAAEEPRIRVVENEKALQISENTNAAMKQAAGDYFVFMDHDDMLTEHALFECAAVINETPEAEVIYSDEDKMSMDGHKFFQPHFKPDFNQDLLCTVNYICHLFVAKRELVEKVGMLRSEFDGAQDYDFIFRCTEEAEKICHIPKILYHWRCHEDSTAENPESKQYAFEAGRRAIEAHYQRKGIHATVENGEFLGLYRTKYILDEKPLISIIIPNKDHIDDLDRCVQSILKKSSYPNLEFIIVENNSTEEKTFAYYEKLQKECSKVQVYYYKGNFNYSKINNFGVQYAKGKYLLLLNNDTEMINDDCIEELLGYCTRSDVGIVGARLYYEDDTIQHAGVVIGFGGIAGHCFVQQPRGNTGYCHRIICAQDYSAVTAACMMVKRSVFEEVGGLTEELAVAFNDIDFCMKVRQKGYLVVYNPYAELYHYESKSRGLEDTPEKQERFHKEIQTFETRWPEILKNGDPYYNPNLSLETQNFSLKRL